MAIEREHVSVVSKSLRGLLCSKGDQEGQGASLGITGGSQSETCPVSTLEAWLQFKALYLYRRYWILSVRLSVPPNQPAAFVNCRAYISGEVNVCEQTSVLQL